jgi:hypothetical protein
MTTLKRLPCVFLLALLSVYLAIPACAGPGQNVIANDLPGITADVNEATLIVSTVETFSNMYFVTHPNPELQGKVSLAFSRVKMAASAALALARGAGDLQGSQGGAALAEFSGAYTDLLALVKSFGVSTSAPKLGGPRMAAAPGGLVVPPASELHLLKGRS